MSTSPRETLLCRYHYDPLDRQAACTLALVQSATLQRFYCTSRLATEIHGAVRTSLFQHDDQLLAQQRHHNEKVDTTLLATDQQRTVLSALDATRPHPLAYTPYGHRPAENGLLSLLGFNGQRPDPVTGHYHLGNGYRQFNPVLMRFNSPDSWSPFGEGGLNAYAYCTGDPVGRSDPTGHIPRFSIFKFLSNINPRTVIATSAIVSIVSGAASLAVKDDDVSKALGITSMATLSTVLGLGAVVGASVIIRYRLIPSVLNRLSGMRSHRVPPAPPTSTSSGRSSIALTQIRPPDPPPPYEPPPSYQEATSLTRLPPTAPVNPSPPPPAPNGSTPRTTAPPTTQSTTIRTS